ncbi:MAG: hypothetical protein U0905_02655 [Pirellulales bacterium]
MKDVKEEEWNTSVAARVAGEDLRPGDYVALSRETIELPSFFWCDSSAIGSYEEPVRIQFLSRESGCPCKIITVCLPFVYAERPSGAVVTFDIRRNELLKLHRKKGCKIFERLKSNGK